MSKLACEESTRAIVQEDLVLNCETRANKSCIGKF